MLRRAYRLLPFEPTEDTIVPGHTCAIGCPDGCTGQGWPVLVRGRQFFLDAELSSRDPDSDGLPLMLPVEPDPP